MKKKHPDNNNNKNIKQNKSVLLKETVSQKKTFTTPPKKKKKNKKKKNNTIQKNVHAISCTYIICWISFVNQLDADKVMVTSFLPAWPKIKSMTTS